jgi:hypothetical protein
MPASEYVLTAMMVFIQRPERRACRLNRVAGYRRSHRGRDNAPFIRSITHAPDQAGLRSRPFHCGVNLAALAIEDYCLALSDFHAVSRAAAQNGRSVTDTAMRPSRFRVRQTVVPLSGAGQSGPRDLCPHRGSQPPSNRVPRNACSTRLIRLSAAPNFQCSVVRR